MANLGSRLQDVELQVKQLEVETSLLKLNLQVITRLCGGTSKSHKAARQCFCDGCRGYFDRAQMKKSGHILRCEFCIRDQAEEDQKCPIVKVLNMIEQRENNTNSEQCKVKCSLNCGKDINFKDQKSHEMNECPNTIMQCKNCPETIMRKLQDNHNATTCKEVDEEKVKL